MILSELEFSFSVFMRYGVEYTIDCQTAMLNSIPTATLSTVFYSKVVWKRSPLSDKTANLYRSKMFFPDSFVFSVMCNLEYRLLILAVFIESLGIILKCLICISALIPLSYVAKYRATLNFLFLIA